MGTNDRWRERRALLLKTCTVFTRIQDLIDAAKANARSLAVFKPTAITDFVIEKDDREWSPKKLAEMRALSQQPDLFEADAWRQTFEVIPKLPYSFSYRFVDSHGKESELQILDWEAGALYWNCIRRHNDEGVALEKVREKYLTEFGKTDLHFFLGTTQQFHFVAPNPWVIVGVFPIPFDKQMDLF